MVETILHLGIFLGAAFLCALEPGPNFVHLSLQAMRKGRRHALLAALGMHFGAYPYIIGAAAGLAGLLAAVPTLLTLLKGVAAGYLIWLGIQTFRHSRGDENPAQAVDDASASGPRPAFRSGLLLVLGNPRTPLFYATFPLLFVSTSFPIAPAVQVLAVALATNAIFLAVDVAFVHALDRLQIRDRLPGAGRLFR